jgi:G3E family GTPase
MTKRPPLLPVVVITGFLGSGKTTLLNRLLADPSLGDSAVFINEFGEIALDHLLVRQVEDGVVLLSSGCICCTVRGELVSAFEDLLRALDNKRVPPFSRVIVETTGLADPVPIIQTLTGHPYLSLRLRLAGIVTLVDAVNGQATLDTHEEARRQASLADRLLLSKTDLCPEGEPPSALLKRLAALNPAAKILRAEKAGAALFDDLVFWRKGSLRSEAQDWLDAPTDDSHNHEDGIRSASLTSDRAMAPAAFEMFLDLLRASHGPQLLRVKGLIKLSDDPSRPVLIQGAQHVFSPPQRLEEWPDDDERSRLVVITHDLDPEAVEALFSAFLGLIAPDRPDRQALEDNPLAISGLKF